METRMFLATAPSPQQDENGEEELWSSQPRLYSQRNFFQASLLPEVKRSS